MNKLKVALIGKYPPDSTYISGGVEAATSYLVKGLARIETLELHILTLRPHGWTKPDQFTQNGVYVHLLPVYPRFERLRDYRIYQSTCNHSLHQIQPAIIHAQEASTNAYISIRSGFPTVVTAHGIRHEDMKYYSSLYRRLAAIYDSLVIERYVMRNVRHLIAISHYVTDYFKGITRPDIEVFYVPNAIDERFFNLARCPDEQVILYAGRVIPLKRVMDLVQAFAQVVNQAPSARMHIAGETSTEPAYAETIKRWVHQSNLDGHVRFLGPLSEEAIFQEFAGCSILALPSAQETAPMVIAQAMAARKPVIATRVGGVGEMVGEDSSRGFLVNVGDIDGLAKSIIRLLQNPDLQALMGQNGRAFAQKNYHPESVARYTSDVYHHIAIKEQKAIV